MDEEQKHIIKFKYGLAIQKLIIKNKKKNKKSSEEIDDSYGKISSSTGLRPATISAIVNADAEPKAYTIHLILAALGYNYTLFGRTLDAITDSELKEYMKQIDDKRKAKK